MSLKSLYKTLEVAALAAVLVCGLVAGDEPPRKVKPRRPGSAATQRRPVEPTAKGRSAGMNLGSIVDWSPEIALVDIFKASRPWIAHGPGELALDKNGYPVLKAGQSVESLMVREIDGHYPAGVYVATYRGRGNVAMGKGDVKAAMKVAPGRIEALVEPGDVGIILEILESDPRDPIRDIHVWLPGSEGAESPFTSHFTERLKPFGTIRFMNWQMINNSPVERWTQRTGRDQARYYCDSGVPLELMIDLSNRMDADPWFCMPHQADDEFVRKFAQMVKERLSPGLNVYVEYSNEVWNFTFGQARHALSRGKALGLGDDDFGAALHYYSQRSVEIFKIWEGVFGDNRRLVRVLGSQFANPWVSQQVLDWREAYRHADALAVAPYFGNALGRAQTQEQVARLGVDRLLSAVGKEIDGPSRELIQKQAEVASQHNVRLIAYEGGQHLVGVEGAENNQALVDLFTAANRSPRMYDLYRKHLRHWFDAGGGLYVVFSYVDKPRKFGSWGVMEYLDQPVSEAPKYRAVLDFFAKKDGGKPRD